jgi:hypothetical protein
MVNINVLVFFHLFIIYYFSFHSYLQFSRGVLDTTLCNKVCQWLAAGQWFSPGTPVSSTNKTDRHDITDILLKVALNTINHKPTITICPILFKYTYEKMSKQFQNPIGKW